MARKIPGDPWVSAVVHLQPEGSALPPEVLADPADPAAVVLSEASAVLQGFNLETRPRPKPAGKRDPGDVRVSGQGTVLARAKAYFHGAGFEVHAPVGDSFSIAGHRSVFERFFGQRLVVNEEEFGAPVTVEGGGREVSIDRLPKEAAALVRAVVFPPPPRLPGQG